MKRIFKEYYSFKHQQKENTEILIKQYIVLTNACLKELCNSRTIEKVKNVNNIEEIYVYSVRIKKRIFQTIFLDADTYRVIFEDKMPYEVELEL